MSIRPHFFNDKESVTADPVRAGTAYVVWDRLQAPSHSPDAALRARAVRGPAWFAKTTDGGTTWSGPTTVATQQFVTDTDPDTGAPLRTGEGLPSAAIDPSTGQLYVVWSDSRFTGGTVNQIVITTSTNGGSTWTTPKVISTVTGRPAFTPTVAVNSAGVVGVTYYDLRNLPAGDTTTLPADYWLTSSADKFATSLRLTPTSFDLLTAPFAGGFFVGDYEALGVNGTRFVPFFVQAEPAAATPPTDVFTNSVSP